MRVRGTAAASRGCGAGLLLVLGACTLDLTDPPITGDDPSRLAVRISVTDLEGDAGCWSVQVSARPTLRDGRFVPVSDSTAWIAGEAWLPSRRPHELASFTYRTAPRCGDRPGSVSVEVPFLAGLDELEWPLAALPMPWRAEPPEVEAPAGGVAVLHVPAFDAPLALPGEVRFDWTARVARALDAPKEQEDHQLLTNSSESSLNTLSIGAPFTDVAGTLWEVRWTTFTRLDRATPSARLEASLEYAVTRFNRLRVVEEGEG